MKRIEEIALKESRVKNFMQKNSLQGVLLKTQANFCWFTGGGLNEVTVADTLGVTSILVTADDRYIISDNIEAPRMMEDEGLADLGFKLGVTGLEHTGQRRRAVLRSHRRGFVEP